MGIKTSPPYVGPQIGPREWTSEHVAEGVFKLYLADLYIGMTGANVTLDLKVKEAHRLERLIIKHTDSADDESTDSLLVTFQRRMLKALLFDKYEDLTLTKSDVCITFDKEAMPKNTDYRFTFNSTNTDRLYIELYIEKLG